MNDIIFSPHFQITPALTAALSDIDRQRWLIDNVLLMPKHETWIRREISFQRAAGTTRIEGASLDEVAVEKLASKAVSRNISEDEQANLNALRAYEFVDYLSILPDVPLDELVVRQINREFLHGFPAGLTPGVYRNGQNTVGMFNPPDQGDVPTLMRAYAKWLAQEDTLNPVLKAAIAHVHLVAIHPFWDGNGRTARALATLVLQRSPYNFKNLLSFDAVCYALRDHYFTAIERTLGRTFSPNYDATPWLEFFCQVVLTNAYRLAGRLTDWRRRVDDVHKELEKLDLNHRQADGLVFAAQVGHISRADYMEITGASPVTASRDLVFLARNGWLNAEGNTRARIYRFAGFTDTPTGPPVEQMPLL